MKYRVLYWNAHAKNKEPVTVYGPDTYNKCLGYYDVMFQHRPAYYSMQRVEDANSLPERDYVKVTLPDISLCTASLPHRGAQYTVPDPVGYTAQQSNVAQPSNVHERIKRLQEAVKNNSELTSGPDLLPGDILLA